MLCPFSYLKMVFLLSGLEKEQIYLTVGQVQRRGTELRRCDCVAGAEYGTGIRVIRDSAVQ
jgi:hypothetical protein